MYAALWTAVLVAGRLPESMDDRAPRRLAAVVISVLGPPVLLAIDGTASATFALSAMLLIAGCLTLARLLWRRYPDSELFGLPLRAAVAVWVGSVWRAALVATV